MPKGKMSKKDWAKMDFIPSVSFETPLPQHKGTRHREVLQAVGTALLGVGIPPIQPRMERRGLALPET